MTFLLKGVTWGWDINFIKNQKKKKKREKPSKN